MQAVGLIVDVGDSVDRLKVGAPVAIMVFGCYAEFIMVCNLHYIFPWKYHFSQLKLVFSFQIRLEKFINSKIFIFLN